jgi:hypothetical protein
MWIAGTEDLDPVAYLDGERVYPRVWGIEVWVVSYRYPQPAFVCSGGTGAQSSSGPPPTLPPECIVDYEANAIDASNGDFVQGFFYGEASSG